MSGRFRFRRRLKIARGLYLNVGKTGTSLSLGMRGAHMTFGRKGTRTTLGLPGTGLSYSTYSPRPAAPASQTPASVWATILVIAALAIIGGVLLALG